ncbi:hypothetical protein ELAC_1378 [Estrella lausannensis]|uniref:Cadherin domain-containing protein n=1 Tax=Estrella lausannensis TaxID=483423 RepID=A0A0H5DSG4_9BACT|nr:hypothetical protein ELAC_1378 [Estrella lausannensis]
MSQETGNGISIVDVDIGDEVVQVVLTSQNGFLTLSQIDGIVFTQGTGSSDSVMVFTGKLSDVNAALEGLTFMPKENYNGEASISLFVSDKTTGEEEMSHAKTIALNIEAVNDETTITAPVDQSLKAGQNLTLSSQDGNAIHIGDNDQNSTYTVTLSVKHGQMTLSKLSGLTFVEGNGANNTQMVFKGSLKDINDALDGLVYTPFSGFSGSDLIAISVAENTMESANEAPVVYGSVAVEIAASPLAANESSIALKSADIMQESSDQPRFITASNSLLSDKIEGPYSQKDPLENYGGYQEHNPGQSVGYDPIELAKMQNTQFSSILYPEGSAFTTLNLSEDAEKKSEILIDPSKPSTKMGSDATLLTTAVAMEVGENLTDLVQGNVIREARGPLQQARVDTQLPTAEGSNLEKYIKAQGLQDSSAAYTVSAFAMDSDMADLTQDHLKMDSNDKSSFTDVVKKALEDMEKPL